MLRSTRRFFAISSTAMSQNSVMNAHAHDLITFDSIKEAAERIKQYVHRTPMMTCSQLNQSAGGKQLFFKCENFQKTGSFKVWLSFCFSLSYFLF